MEITPKVIMVMANKGLERLDKVMKEHGRESAEYNVEFAKFMVHFAFEKTISDAGKKKSKQLMEKFWAGTRLDDQELRLTFSLCTIQNILDNKTFSVSFTNEIGQEMIERFGGDVINISDPFALLTQQKFINKTHFLEPNPYFIPEVLKKLVDILEIKPRWNK